MINSLQVKNFKAFKDTKKIELAPITLFLGSNSSGKSSLIQSILMLKQTLESTVMDEPILLNGAYVSLGNYEDVSNFYNEKEEIDIYINFSNKGITQTDSSLNYYDYLRNHISKTGVSISVSPQNDNSGLLNKVTYYIGRNKGEVSRLTLEKKDELSNLIRQKYKPISSLSHSDFLYKLDKSKDLTLMGETPEAFLLNNIIPETALIPYNDNLAKIVANFHKELLLILFEIFGIENKKPRNIKSLQRFLMQNIRKFNNDMVEKIDEKSLDDILQKIKEIVSLDNDEVDHFIFTINENDYIKSVYQVLKVLPANKLTILTNFLENISLEIEKAKHSTHSLVQKPARNINFINSNLSFKFDFDDLIYLIRNRFNKIYYLGPLRDEPRAIYNRFPSHDPTYVGQKGENVAFVLKHYSNKIITAVLPPESSSELNMGNLHETKIELGLAVKAWLKYLGVAQDVNVQTMGKLGLSIQVNVYGEKQVDLTNVGVGVSQILPVIVLGLLSPQEDSILILEQPELHLHPYVQSKLGDFFTAMSFLGKQVIVETHSEHLINKLRYHIATGRIKYEEDALIYFVEKSEHSQSSTLAKVIIDEFGTLQEYPKGFFDVTEKQLEEILDAAFSRMDLNLRN